MLAKAGAVIFVACYHCAFREFAANPAGISWLSRDKLVRVVSFSLQGEIKPFCNFVMKLSSRRILASSSYSIKKYLPLAAEYSLIQDSDFYFSKTRIKCCDS